MVAVTVGVVLFEAACVCLATSCVLCFCHVWFAAMGVRIYRNKRADSLPFMTGSGQCLCFFIFFVFLHVVPVTSFGFNNMTALPKKQHRVVSTAPQCELTAMFCISIILSRRVLAHRCGKSKTGSKQRPFGCCHFSLHYSWFDSRAHIMSLEEFQTMRAAVIGSDCRNTSNVPVTSFDKLKHVFFCLNCMPCRRLRPTLGNISFWRRQLFKSTCAT